MSNEFYKRSYDLHRSHYENIPNKELAPLWTDKESVDYFRHRRMYECLDPLLSSYKNSTWLTVGDGRYGTDANYILSKGEEKVLATDIADTYLKVAKEKNFINDYKVENAEQMSFEDSSFDFVLCKEAYHHFPRPYMALYEMLRVAKKGVILIEPNDNNIPNSDITKKSLIFLKKGIKNFLKKILNREPYYEYGRYETVGNYVYTISEREIEKVALGLNYDLVAFKGLNDFYIEGGESEKRTSDSPLFLQLQKEISRADKMVKDGKIMYGLLIAIIFKDIPSKECISELKKSQFILKTLSKNPYIN